MSLCVDNGLCAVFVMINKRAMPFRGQRVLGLLKTGEGGAYNYISEYGLPFLM